MTAFIVKNTPHIVAIYEVNYKSQYANSTWMSSTMSDDVSELEYM